MAIERAQDQDKAIALLARERKRLVSIIGRSACEARPEPERCFSAGSKVIIQR
jgi:hypothetical protein